VIPAAFEYARAGSVAEALGMLQGNDVKILAGGQSLIPLMKLRFARPSMLVDISRLEELRYVRDGGDSVSIGAAVTHHQLSRGPLIASRCALLARAASDIGDPQVRHLGTIGGSVAHADPAGDLPMALLALDATLVVSRADGTTREIGADSFFLGAFTTAMTQDEMLVEIRVPRSEGAVSFIKFRRRALDWATVGVAALARRGEAPAVALASMGDRPLRAAATEGALSAGASIAEAAALADEGTDPANDVFASAEYRRALARVLVRRALEDVAP
jgi:carbon-monoxide dehydrogenase medium subunit